MFCISSICTNISVKALIVDPEGGGGGVTELNHFECHRYYMRTEEISHLITDTIQLNCIFTTFEGGVPGGGGGRLHYSTSRYKWGTRVTNYCYMSF